MPDVLFTRPADDSSSAQIATWGQALLQRVGARTYADLVGPAATRTAVDRVLDEPTRAHFHFGHGTEDYLVGNDGAIVDAGNASRVSQAIVAIACESAVGLGPIAVSGGTRAYLGFDDILGFPARAPLPTALAVTGGLGCIFTRDHPLDCAATQLRKGLGMAGRDYKERGAEYGLDRSETRLARVFMKHNLYSLQLLGDPTTTI